jgi:FkbM family methyltransferase
MGKTAQRSIVTLSGRLLTFVGDEQDAYFNGLEAFYNQSQSFEKFIRGNLRAAANCLDVGANVGLTAALLATCCPEGRVFAIEASPKNARYLRENIARNGLGNCVVIETAVGNRNGSLSFFEAGFGAGSHVLSMPGAGGAGSRTVPVTSLDTLFAGSPAGSRIDFMKLDVEGFEPVAISGARRLIERDRCTIYMEFNSWCLQLLHEFNPFVFAKALGATFDLATLGEDGDIRPLAPGGVHGFMYRNIMQKGCVDDVVLRLKDGARIPPLADMIKGADDLRNYHEVYRLRAALKAAGDARYFGLGKWLESSGDGDRGPPPASAMDLEPAPAPTQSRPPAAPRVRSRVPKAAGVERPLPAQRPIPAGDPRADGPKNMHIQLMRALAILMVLWAHLSISNSVLMHLPFPIANPGWIGVELFFVVSGYVVTQSFERGAFSVAGFAVRRLFRLYPLLLLFLATTVFVKLVCDLLVPAAPPLFSPTFETMIHQTLAMLFAYHPTVEWGSTFSNSALWSLTVELRFYAALALLVGVLNLIYTDTRSHRRSILIAALIVCAIGIVARVLACFGITFTVGDVIISKMYEFIALGVIIALMPAALGERIARAAKPAVWPLLFATVALVAAIGSPYSHSARGPVAFQLTMLVLGVVFALLFIVGVSSRAWHLAPRVQAFADFFGERSYALFLLHLPVFNIAWALGQYLGFDGGYWQWPLFQLVVSTLLLAPLVEAAHRWIELPMIETGKSVSAWLRRAGIGLVRPQATRTSARVSWDQVRWERAG